MRVSRMLVAVAAVAALAGCGGSAGGSEDGAALPESDYLRLVRQNVSTLSDAGDAPLRELGQEVVCDNLRAGDTTSWLEVLATMKRGGMPPRQAGELIAYATSTYCTEKLSALPQT